MNIELLLSALVAAGLVFWLRSILGTRHGEENQRQNPFATPAADEKSVREPEIANDEAIPLAGLESNRDLPVNASVANEALFGTLESIARIEPSFHPKKFILAAQDAFAMIVESFAAADRETLKEFLEPNVYNAFDGAMKDRESRGETMSNQIHAVTKTEILDARLEGKKAFVTMRFIAQESYVIKNAQGEIISGNPDRVSEMNDIWTFSRMLGLSDPKWLLQETRDGDVIEESKTPIPDTV